jgi:hypothetical protein
MVGAFTLLFLIIGISGFLVPEALIGSARVRRDLAVGSLIVIGALVMSGAVMLAVQGAGMEAVLVVAGVLFGTGLGWLLTMPAIVPPPAPPNRLYRIVHNNHRDSRWQAGQLVCMRSADAEEQSPILAVEVRNGFPTEAPSAYTITLALLQADCRNCPSEIPVIFDEASVTG